MFTSSILYSVLACLFWGLIFVGPLYLASFDCIDIVLGRFLAFGAGSLLTLGYVMVKHQDWKLLSYWKPAILCSLIMNLGYFTALTLGMRLSNPSLITIIVGLAPIFIVGLESRTENSPMPLSTLMKPVLAIFGGIILFNIETLQSDWQTYSGWQYISGILYGFLALAAWCWYVIYNTQFLQKNPHIKPVGWTALIGAVTLIFTVIASLVRWWTADPSYLQKFSLNASGYLFIGVSLVLGLICSLLAFSLWNMASSRLPSALSGQLAILETIFGLIMISVYNQSMPTLLEFVGIALVIGGVWRGLYCYHKTTEAQSNAA